MTRSKKKSNKQCGLCGATQNLTRTYCCDQWICDDQNQYVMFSFAHNSCSRNHGRRTLCGHHAEARHVGTWQECAKCRSGVETELYVYFGTNEYNFEKLANPPTFEPTRCGTCKATLKLGEEGFSQRGKEYYCEACTERRLAHMTLGSEPEDLRLGQ